MNPSDTSTTSGASRATDFQPTTRNPQGNVGGGLQPNSANLQPISPPNGSNIFNQPGVNPQAFPQTDSLKVLSSSTGTPASNPPENNTYSPGSSSYLLPIIIGIITLGILLFIVLTARPAGKTNEKKPQETVVTKPVAKKKTTKKKPKTKAKTKKRK